VEYRTTLAVAQEANLPPATAGRVAQLAAESGPKAVAIQNNPALTAEQRRAYRALLDLSEQYGTHIRQSPYRNR
jgi:hypothetical protein